MMVGNTPIWFDSDSSAEDAYLDALLAVPEVSFELSDSSVYEVEPTTFSDSSVCNADLPPLFESLPRSLAHLVVPYREVQQVLQGLVCPTGSLDARDLHFSWNSDANLLLDHGPLPSFSNACRPCIVV